MNSSNATSGRAEIFRKKVFTPKTLVLQLYRVLVSLPMTILCFVSPRNLRSLREQMVLAVTQVNGCRWCEWGHTHVALSNGVDVDQLNLFLSGVTDTTVSEAEGVAILFAQHCASEQGRIAPELLQTLKPYYSDSQIREIKAVINTIYFGNLLGNTFDAFLARLKGQRVEGSNIVIELITLPLAGPIAVVGKTLSMFDDKVELKKS